MSSNTERRDFLVENINMPEVTGVDGADWEDFQHRHLIDDGAFRIETKSRQIAWSWLSAAEAVANAVLYGQDSIFVSINLEEAKEKIRYARSIIEHLARTTTQVVSLERDNDLGITFRNGARLTSLPARPPRGRARANVYLDEFAHVQFDREIYTAALPVISKGGRLRIGSSPMGASGVFWEVFSQAIRPYPGYTRKTTPWWETFAFCADPLMARREAPLLMTAQRVDRFGNDRIKTICANMPVEDFRQEYECDFVDETTAWITWEEIKSVSDARLVCTLASSYEKATEPVFAAIENTERLIREGKIEDVLVAGVDIGRTRDTTEIFLVGMSTVDTFPLRLAITLDNCEYDTQIDVMDKVLRALPVRSMRIDRNGIGNQLAETMSGRFPSKVVGVNFTTSSKGLWATDAKMLIQQRKTPLPPDRDIAYQIHSIKRIVTGSNNLVFDTATNEKHHADKFWAWVLALAGTQYAPTTVTTTSLPDVLQSWRGITA